MAYVTIRELAQLLGVSEDTVRRRVKRGDYPIRTDQRPQGKVYQIEVPDQLAANLHAPSADGQEQTAAYAPTQAAATYAPRTDSEPLVEALQARIADLVEDKRRLQGQVDQLTQRLLTAPAASGANKNLMLVLLVTVGIPLLLLVAVGAWVLFGPSPTAGPATSAPTMTATSTPTSTPTPPSPVALR